MTVSDSVALRPILRPQVKLIGNINGFSGPTCAILLELIKVGYIHNYLLMKFEMSAMHI